MSTRSLGFALLFGLLALMGGRETLAADLSLSSAKTQGLVGEQYDGYLGQVAGGADVQRLIANVNAERRAQYQRIAQANNISLAAVEARAGQKTIEKTAPSHLIKLQGQGWRKK